MTTETDPRRRILEEVAAGVISPADAAERLAGLDHSPTPARGEHEPAAGSLTTVRISGSFRSATIIGDPDVAEVVAEGDHTARREGDAIVIDAEAHIEGEGTAYHYGRKRDAHVVLGAGSRPLPLTVRMNPALALDAQLAAGVVRIRDVRGPINAEVSAGSVKIDGFAAPLTVDVSGGTVHASGRLDHGTSKIRCEAGAVRVTLDPASSTTISARAGIGKVSLPHAEGGRASLIGGGSRETTIGDGAARLDIEAGVGAITVELA